MHIPNLQKAPGHASTPTLSSMGPIDTPYYFRPAVGCSVCKSWQFQSHSAADYNKIITNICRKCGANAGCWQDVKIKCTNAPNRAWWKPWTWEAIEYTQLLPAPTPGHEFPSSKAWPLEVLHDTLVFASKDWGTDSSDAWIYGIVAGWDDEALAELQKRFTWPDEAIRRLKKLHAACNALSESPAPQPAPQSTATPPGEE